MAANLHTTPTPLTPQSDVPPGETLAEAPALFRPTHAYLAHLAALHDEAAETAYLANLLGRAPWAAGLLGAVGLVTICMNADLASLSWLVLIGLAVGVVARRYQQTIVAPFARPALKLFAQDLSAVLLYAGFAWGAGIFLALPAGTSAAVAIAFTAGTAVAIATILRARDVAFCFVVPATAMGTFCALMRLAGVVEIGGILGAGAIVIGLVALLDRYAAPRKSFRLVEN